MPASAAEYFFLIPSLAISLAIVVPLSGVLVRFRASYNPRGLALDSEGSAVPHTGPVVSSYFGMLRRVWQIEGFSGFYKGLMPTLVTALAISLIILTFMDAPGHRHSSYKAPSAGILGTLLYSLLMMFISLPNAIITCAITTPHKLPYFGLMKSLRVLLTPTERRQPWILYLTPGLLASQCLHIAYVTLVLAPLRRLLVPIIEESGFVAYSELSWIKISVYFAVVVVSAGILTPLEVISTRLAIQRNQASSEYNSVSQEVEGDAEEIAEYAGADEDVIGLRTDAEPYTGLLDCGKTIINEEGFMALYKAWWLTFFGGLVSAFA
ncbi:mitochondrial carrier domain-containing protein [Mycena olivaceomarginata]|nr:mitochondrial carrier domain-containing protein [Mycena olivaceomarginata]